MHSRQSRPVHQRPCRCGIYQRSIDFGQAIDFAKRDSDWTDPSEIALARREASTPTNLSQRSGWPVITCEKTGAASRRHQTQDQRTTLARRGAGTECIPPDDQSKQEKCVYHTEKELQVRSQLLAESSGETGHIGCTATKSSQTSRLFTMRTVPTCSAALSIAARPTIGVDSLSSALISLCRLSRLLHRPGLRIANKNPAPRSPPPRPALDEHLDVTPLATRRRLRSTTTCTKTCASTAKQSARSMHTQASKSATLKHGRSCRASGSE